MFLKNVLKDGEFHFLVAITSTFNLVLKVIFQVKTPAFDLRFGKNKRMPVGNANQGHGKVVSRPIYCALQKLKINILRSKDLEHPSNFEINEPSPFEYGLHVERK
ncbi:hypothetical protein TSAR_000268 [Trichomalopsis sarcophagae]|uniref:Uncharacterized protein n=1 Tax=Trichomalopsis sarcophagae TaxID=543379 RepID=A0A232EJT1_9HYME|nr:hypothetical protein TSAR_000268 [Trichomalopsis sarcophagae]